ncbi:tigger transposable element-derived protein 6-like protein [Plakobranchus ocellatus]|uniref:Tigger transposable element-derived protein 6-like protein n=1 Tax=Plakobranchus ocellatus TaxID=259542 RepID=A0AAV3YWD2_9GAST|nr:tigger transposable element-derived protein 6-like protein [Plakobranchus ocellatus]
MSIKKAAQHFGVPRTTLSDKVNEKYPVHPTTKTVLTPQEEQKIVDWLIISARRGCGFTKDLLCLVIQKVLNAEGRKTVFTDNKPGRTWLDGFLKRHPEVKQRKTSVLGEQRAHLTEGKIRAWFGEVETSLAEDGVDIRTVDPRCVFNADETGVPLHSSGQVVLTDASNKHPYTIGSDNKRQISILGCASASGERLPPLVIFPGKRWTFRPEEDFPGAVCKQTDNGWVNSEVFRSWLLETFVPHVQDLPRPVVLFCDGHTSHVSLEVHDICKANGIVYFLLPSHASHVVQPLDLVYYGNFKREWKAALNWHRIINKVASIFPRTFMPVFRDAWQRCYCEDHIKTAFRKSGLSPWNPDAPDYSKCSASYIYGKARPQCEEQPGTSAAEDPPVKETLCSTPSKPDDQLDLQKEEEEEIAFAPLPDLSLDWFPHFQEAEPLVELGLQEVELNVDEVTDDGLVCPPQEFCQLSPGVAESVDQLIDFIISTGWTSSDMYWVRRRQWANERPKEDEHSYRKYLELYNSIVPPPSFDSLPVPDGWTKKLTNVVRKQPPKYISGNSYKAFEESKVRAAEAKKQEAEERKQERIRKKAEKEEEKKRKKEEQQRKQSTGTKQRNLKRKAGERKMEKVGVKRRAKNKAKVESDSEEELDSDFLVESDCSSDLIMPRDQDESDEEPERNSCYVCGRRQDYEGWVGCDTCDRWYHKRCCGARKKALLKMTTEELENFQFICVVCKGKRLFP